MKATITKDTFINGKPVKTGDVVDIDQETFVLLKEVGKAEAGAKEKAK